jgi:CRISPR-associated protein Csb2
MPIFLCFTVRFLQPYSHGRGDGDDPEWPPSPLRLFQAMVASSAGHWNERTKLASAASALNWLEAQTPPKIVAAQAARCERPYRLYVPDNVADKVAASWSRGRDADIADYRTEKDVRPMYLSGEAVHYLYLLRNGRCPHAEVLTAAARSITHLGWGVDMVVGDATILSDDQAAALDGHRWRPSPVGGRQLRVPTKGTLDDLARKHKAFLNRLSGNGFRPVPPLKVFRVHGYRRNGDPLPRPYRVFELRRMDGGRFRYPSRRLIHITGMVRHLAIAAMKTSPPTGVGDDWVSTYVAGHTAADSPEHRQLSYLPLPSIGDIHTDPGVRRIMIVAPLGDDARLSHVARHLAERMLQPLRGDEFADKDPPLLVPIRHDNIARFYTKPANTWASVTPVILPGHDDHKPEKTRKLIEKALQQSGVDLPCEFEWGAFSRFPKSLSAHKYDRDKRPSGYIRPDHLLSQTAVHLTLRFNDNLKVPGPLAIGAGRHCGFGLMASAEPWWCHE